MKDFPLLTRICVSPGFDMEALLKAGYNSTNSYFSGKSRFNHDFMCKYNVAAAFKSVAKRKSNR